MNRLRDLRSQAGLRTSVGGLSPSSYGSTDTAARMGEATPTPEGNLGELQRIADEIKPLLADVRDISAEIDSYKKLVLNATSVEKEQKLGAKVQAYIDRGKKDIKDIKGAIDELKRIQNEHELSPAEGQMCSTLLLSAGKDLTKVLQLYMKSQEDYHEAVRKKVERQLRIAYPDAKEHEIADLAREDPESVREAISQQLRRAPGENNLQMTLVDLHAKYDDMRALEQSVLELRDMFLYLSAIVDEQGKTLDSIEETVKHTEEYTGNAVERLQVAKESKDNYDRRRCYLWLASFGGIIAIIAICAIWLFPMLSPLISMCTGCCRGSCDSRKDYSDSNLRVAEQQGTFAAQEDSERPVTTPGVSPSSFLQYGAPSHGVHDPYAFPGHYPALHGVPTSP